MSEVVIRGEDELIRLELERLATIYDGAGGMLLKLTNYTGSLTESMMEKLPPDWRDQVALATEKALFKASEAAAGSHASLDAPSRFGRALNWARGSKWHVLAAGVSGAVTGLAGLPGALVDLPVSTTLLLRSIQEVTAEHGEDIASSEVRAECISVLGMGGQEKSGQGSVSLAAARLAVSGNSLSQIISRVLPHFSSQMMQKIAAQAMPLLGAVAGGGVNALFANYYRSLAEVHFGVRRLKRETRSTLIDDSFSKILSDRRAVATEVAAKARARPAWAHSAV